MIHHEHTSRLVNISSDPHLFPPLTRVSMELLVLTIFFDFIVYNIKYSRACELEKKLITYDLRVDHDSIILVRV